jgi:hypothetical protein
VRVRRYVTPAGADPVAKFLDALPAREAARVLETALARMKDVLSGEE